MWVVGGISYGFNRESNAHSTTHKQVFPIPTIQLKENQVVDKPTPHLRRNQVVACGFHRKKA
jgi:hypothetical protein